MFESLEDFDDLHSKPSAFQANMPMSVVGSLDDLDLDAELYQTYAKAKNFLSTVEYNEEIPPNQVSQVINTITAILKEIVRLQTDLHNAERVKKLEQAMITALKVTPKETQELFFEEYERLSASV